MTSKLPENPKRRVPDWRITLPLAQASPRCGARYQNGHALQGTSDGLREVQDAWRRQHWPTHRRGVGAHPEGPDDAWAAHGGDGPDARDGAGSDGWREAAGGAEMMTAAGAEMHGACRRRSHLAGDDPRGFYLAPVAQNPIEASQAAKQIWRFGSQLSRGVWGSPAIFDVIPTTLPHLCCRLPEC